jgi:membrane associated rhomboid family serine protease
VGASGAIFGLFGALFVGMRRRGIDVWRSGIGTLIVINLVITFAIPFVSKGGHLGGLVGGGIAGWLMFHLDDQRRSDNAGVAVGVAVAVVSVAIAMVMAS